MPPPHVTVFDFRASYRILSLVLRDHFLLEELNKKSYPCQVWTALCLQSVLSPIVS